jgi:hypothetical protein
MDRECLRNCVFIYLLAIFISLASANMCVQGPAVPGWEDITCGLDLMNGAWSDNITANGDSSLPMSGWFNPNSWNKTVELASTGAPNSTFYITFKAVWGSFYMKTDKLIKVGDGEFAMKRGPWLAVIRAYSPDKNKPVGLVCVNNDTTVTAMRKANVPIF